MHRHTLELTNYTNLRNERGNWKTTKGKMVHKDFKIITDVLWRSKKHAAKECPLHDEMPGCTECTRCLVKGFNIQQMISVQNQST